MAEPNSVWATSNVRTQREAKRYEHRLKHLMTMIESFDGGFCLITRPKWWCFVTLVHRCLQCKSTTRRLTQSTAWLSTVVKGKNGSKNAGPASQKNCLGQVLDIWEPRFSIHRMWAHLGTKYHQRESSQQVPPHGIGFLCILLLRQLIHQANTQCISQHFRLMRSANGCWRQLDGNLTDESCYYQVN